MKNKILTIFFVLWRCMQRSINFNFMPWNIKQYEKKNVRLVQRIKSMKSYIRLDSIHLFICFCFPNCPIVLSFCFFFFLLMFECLKCENIIVSEKMLPNQLYLHPPHERYNNFVLGNKEIEQYQLYQCV